MARILSPLESAKELWGKEGRRREKIPPAQGGWGVGTDG